VRCFFEATGDLLVDALHSGALRLLKQTALRLGAIPHLHAKKSPASPALRRLLRRRLLSIRGRSLAPLTARIGRP
jgi:hypothetical protein